MATHSRQPIPMPGKSHGQGSLTSYSPWGHEEPDTIEQLTRTQSVDIYNGIFSSSQHAT